MKIHRENKRYLKYETAKPNVLLIIGYRDYTDS